MTDFFVADDGHGDPTLRSDLCAPSYWDELVARVTDAPLTESSEPTTRVERAIVRAERAVYGINRTDNGARDHAAERDNARRINAAIIAANRDRADDAELDRLQLAIYGANRTDRAGNDRAAYERFIRNRDAIAFLVGGRVSRALYAASIRGADPRGPDERDLFGARGDEYWPDRATECNCGEDCGYC